MPQNLYDEMSAKVVEYVAFPCRRRDKTLCIMCIHRLLFYVTVIAKKVPRLSLRHHRRAILAGMLRRYFGFLRISSHL